MTPSRMRQNIEKRQKIGGKEKRQGKEGED